MLEIIEIKILSTFVKYCFTIKTLPVHVKESFSTALFRHYVPSAYKVSKCSAGLLMWSYSECTELQTVYSHVGSSLLPATNSTSLKW